jgi:2,3-dihydroxybenzoate-AMP ligase
MSVEESFPVSSVTDFLENGITPWPADFVARYQEEGLWGDRSVGAMLHASALMNADAVAVVSTQGQLTYRELDEGSDRFAAALLELGLVAGDRALLQLGNNLETTIVYYGLIKAGVIPACAIPQHGARDMLHLAHQTRACLCVAQGDFASQDLVGIAKKVRAQSSHVEHVIVTRGASLRTESFERLLERQSPRESRREVDGQAVPADAVAVFQLSGGTTGTPKVIPRLHCEYVCNSLQWAAACDWGRASVVLHGIPLIHNAGIAAAMQPIHFVGGRLVLPQRADPDEMLSLIESERVDTMPVVPPAVIARLLDHDRLDDYERSSLREVIVGGQKLPSELADRIETELGIACQQMFGMAEGMFMRVAHDAPEWARKHTIGAPICALDEVRVLEPGSETPVAAGELGELCCRGPYTIRGYFHATEHNARAFTSDGFYRTGDLARAHAVPGYGTYFSVDGRIKDVINRGAEKISAEDVEDVIACHPAVARVAVVAMPDPVLGERACAYVVTQAEQTQVTLEALCAFLLEQGMAKFKLPERLEVVDELPLANIGKVDKKALRADVAHKLETEKA